MAWNFRKRIKIAPGIHLNLSKGGISTSIGPKGAKISIGKKGTYLNTSIPGTGLYSRKKLTDNSSNYNIKSNDYHSITNTTMNFLGCLIKGWGLFCLFGLICSIIMFFQGDNRALWGNIIYLPCVIVIFRKQIVGVINRIQGKDDSLEEELSEVLSSEDRVEEQSRYDFFLEKYNNAEKRVIESADREINKVQTQIEATSDPIKKQFLQSFVDHYKYDKLDGLISYSKYRGDDLGDAIDPMFIRVAEKIVANQKYDYVSFLEWFGYNQDVDRYYHIIHQLCDCGIIDRNFEVEDMKICVNSISELNKITKKIHGHTLLSKEDKQKLNDYFDQRRAELIGEQELCSVLSTELPEPYLNVVNAYEALASSKSKWEIVSSMANTEERAYASTLVDKKEVYVVCGRNFNYIEPCKDFLAPFFEFKQGGIGFYIYPEYVIAARSETNFDVISLKDFSISFKKQNFVETSNLMIPKDAKLVRYTYKYVNKNGERDARYSDNPRYAVYEYGDITFLPYRLTMQFSNSEFAENFYKKVQMYKNGGKEPVDSNFGATETYYNKVLDVTKPLCDFYDRILQNRRVMLTVDGALTDEIGDSHEKFRFLFLSDLIKCYTHLGHDATNLLTLEGLPMAILEGHTISETAISYNTIQQDQFKKVATSISGVNKTVMDNFLKDKSEDFFRIKEVLNACGLHDLVVQYFSLLYRFFSVIAKADDTITPDEAKWLEQLISFSQSSKHYENDSYLYDDGTIVWKDSKDNQEIKNEKTDKEKPTNKETDQVNPVEELQSLIGLAEVKDEVSALANFVKIQQEREKKGLKAVGLSYHCVFTGNPGTGKTTVARILAAIYRDLGILKKGHLVETDRSGLVAEYVGQTAVKTNKIIDSALDGVLFIDEAYSLVQGGGNDYGQEAISTLLKRMEDDRDRLIVVLAGYSEDMKRFIDSNPGLQSRFNRYIHFADYSADELKQIFMLNVDKNQYLLDEEGQTLLDQILTFATEHKDKNFGNGRYVRNLFEKTIQNQAMRLSCQPNITVDELSKLKAEDLPINKK